VDGGVLCSLCLLVPCDKKKTETSRLASPPPRGMPPEPCPNPRDDVYSLQPFMNPPSIQAHASPCPAGGATNNKVLRLRSVASSTASSRRHRHITPLLIQAIPPPYLYPHDRRIYLDLDLAPKGLNKKGLGKAHIWKGVHAPQICNPLGGK
jgi:hypothetical protein